MFKTQNLYQNDKKWKNLKLGNSSETIGGWGGLLTSVTMMLNGIGYNETPETVNEKIKRDGGFLRALPIPSLLSYVWPNCIYRGMTRCEKSSVPFEKIDAAVDAGKPVILEVDSKEEKGVQTHFVLVKEKKGDDYVLYDPFKHDGDGPDKEVLLTKRYKHNGAKLDKEISAVFWFDFDNPALPKPPKVTKVPIPTDQYILYAAEDDLVLRAKPSAKGYPWKRMVAGTKLICLESQATVKAKLGVDGHWIRLQDPHGVQGYVAAKYVISRRSMSQRRKWCLKNVVVENPKFETQYLDGEIVQDHTPDKSFDSLLKSTVIDVLQSNETRHGSSEIRYQKTYYDSARKKWVTTRMTGWLKDADLDDYCERTEEFQKFVVDIRNQTEKSTDAQQYLYIKDEKGELRARYNMCGELCVASIIEKDSEAVLSEWRDRSKESKALYDSMVGKADKPLGPRHIENLFNIHIGEDNYERYKMDKQGNPLKEYVILAASNEEQPRADQRLGSQALQDKLETHYFITNLKIDTNTGDLEEAHSAGERNHWVVLDRITRNGSRVELYNPFPNRREEYSFGEFYRSIGGDPNSGWWIKREVNPTFARQKMAAANLTIPAPKIDARIDERKAFARSNKAAVGRKRQHEPEPTEEAFQPPKFEVAIDNRTDDTKDAEQYVYIPGGGSKKRNNLCGEFSVAFILGQSMDTALAHWQEGIKKASKQPEIWELATLLQAYGFNRRKYLAENGLRTFYTPPKVEPDTPAQPEKYIKSFSIDTVLEYWKGVQPDLYNSILGENRDEPTGPEDLITILKAYGYGRSKAKGNDKAKDNVYDREDYSYYRPGSQDFFGYSPVRDAEALKTHFVIAGVHINNRTGRLRPSGVAHWVVVTKITPQGNLVGGNGGWVELYNPFPNCWEEYSYREFMASFSGSSEGATLWVKKDISPVFEPQPHEPAKSKEKASQKKAIGKGNKNSKSNQKAEKDRQRDEEKGKRKKDAGLENDYDKPVLDIPRLVRERLEVTSIPREIGRWIRNKSEEDPFFAETLAEAVRESGLLAIEEKGEGNKKTKTAILADLASSDMLKIAKNIVNNLASSPEDLVFRIASAALPLFTARAIDEIKTVQETMPVQAYKSRPEFMAWTHGLAQNVVDPLETEIQERLKNLFISQQDQSKVFEHGSMLIPQFTPWARKELEKIYHDVSEKIEKIHSDPQIRENIKRVRPPNAQEKISWGEFEEWARGIASTPRPNVYRVRKWGDPVMKEFAFDINIKKFSSNFQAVGLYNTATGFGAISNYLLIPPNDVSWLENLQIEDEYEAKVPDWLHQKMSWLCQERGSIYMFASKEKGRSPWRRPDGIRWGTLALGGNLVQVAEWKEFDFDVTTPSGKKVRNMARLVGFTSKDMVKPMDQLLAEGLVHRCYAVNPGNVFRDSPQGIVYSPFWSPREWEFTPKPKKGTVPTDLWIPACYLENPPGGIECIPPNNLG